MIQMETPPVCVFFNVCAFFICEETKSLLGSHPPTVRYILVLTKVYSTAYYHLPQILDIIFILEPKRS